MSQTPHSIDQLLEQMVARNASDLHLSVGSAPGLRVRGHIERLDEFSPLTPEDTRQLLYRILNSERQKLLEINRQLDFSHSIPGVARFRVNVYFQRESVGAVFRLIPDELKTLEELGLPLSLRELAEKPRGLVLVTGPTGSGKSTTLAAMIDEINRGRAEHILTIEDPIEFVHRHKRCIVNQREIGPDAPSFAAALRAALRQDPDVILVGEMRDLETIGIALTAAETGHLVLGTLHTQSAPGTIDRIIDVFAAEQQEQVRMQIAGALQGVVTQALMPTADGQGRVAALEILLPDDAVRNLIRQAKVEQVYSIMQTSTGRGMLTMEQSLADLIVRGVVTYETAVSRSSRPEQLRGQLERMGIEIAPVAEPAAAPPPPRSGPVCGWRADNEMDERIDNPGPDEATPETTPTGADYSWNKLSVEPADATWRAPEPDALPELRPAWAPAIWEPAAPAAEQAPPEAPAPPAPAEPAPPVQPVAVVAPTVSSAAVDPAPAVEPAPEPDPEPDPVAAAPASSSFLKKEISFRRKPKAPKEPKAAKEPKAEQTAEAKASGGLLKKEISFRRKPKAPKAEQTAQPVAEPKPASEPKPAGGSFLKREISFGRKSKGPKAPKAERAATATTAAPRPAGTSFLKKDLSFKRRPKAAGGAPKSRQLRLPRRSGGGGSSSTKKLVGLKVGASQLAAARVLNNQVVQVARQPLPSGIVVGGELRDADALADQLRDFFNANKLPKRGVRLGLANNRIGVRVFEVDGIEDTRQLANAVRFRAQEALPIPIDEAVLDWQVLGERVDDDGKTVHRVLLVVAYRELVDRYVSACRKAGLQLAGIDLEAFALLRALSAPGGTNGEDGAALVAVSVGHDRSTFAVSDGRNCEFTRVLEWGGSNLDVAVARVLDLAPSEAEPFKRALGLEGDETPEGLTGEKAAAAREAIRREVQTFARELVSSLQFYQNQPGSLGIAEIVVTGGTAHLEGLGDELQKLIGVRVRVGDPLEHVRTGKRLKGADQVGSLAVAIGLGVDR